MIRKGQLGQEGTQPIVDLWHLQDNRVRAIGVFQPYGKFVTEPTLGVLFKLMCLFVQVNVELFNLLR